MELWTNLIPVKQLTTGYKKKEEELIAIRADKQRIKIGSLGFSKTPSPKLKQKPIL